MNRIISDRSLRQWATTALPPLPNNSLNAACAETSNGVAAVAAAIDNRRIDNSNNDSDDDMPAAQLAKQAVIDARRLAAMSRDWTIDEEDPNSSGGKPKSFDEQGAQHRI